MVNKVFSQMQKYLNFVELQFSSNVGNINAMIKLNAKFDIVAMLIAVPLIFNGMISEIRIHAIGPKEKAKQAIKVTILPTETHFRSRPSVFLK